MDYTQKEFEAAVAKEVKKQLAAASKVEKVLSQDQYDMLTVVAPNRAARHEYRIAEPEPVTEE